MATPAQIAANRLNAQKSTGPSSVEGKAASRLNALQHGIDAQSLIIPGEDPAALDALRADYYRTLSPQGPAESALVDMLIASDWQQRRCRRIEAALLNRLLAAHPGDPDALGAIYADAPAGHPLHRIARRLDSVTRTWFRAHKELRTLQQERTDAAAEVDAEAAVAAEAQPEPAAGPALAPVPAPATPAPSIPPATHWVRSNQPAQPAAPPAAAAQPRPRPTYFIG